MINRNVDERFSTLTPVACTESGRNGSARFTRFWTCTWAVSGSVPISKNTVSENWPVEALVELALYKAMGGGWHQGRSRPLLDDVTRETMGERSDWKTMLRAPLPAPGAEP